MFHSNKYCILFLVINLSLICLSREILTDLDEVLSDFSIDKVNNFLESEINEIQKVGNVANDLMCTMQLSWFTKALKEGKLWALKLFDSWGKPNAGYLSGNFVSFGHFDQCLRFSYNYSKTMAIPSIPKPNKRIEGQYCNIILSFFGKSKEENTTKEERFLIERVGGLAVTFGICIPKICNPDYFKVLLDRFAKQSNIPIAKYNQSEQCSNGEDPEFGALEIAAISVLSIFAALIVASTTYDIITVDQDNRVPILLAFSFYTNLLRLFKTHQNQEKDPNMIGCLNGIRVLSILWIILAHRMTSMYAATPTINYVYFLEWIKNYSSMIIYAGTVSVDTFFLLSGFLITWGIFKELDKKKTINVFYMYIHRYIRLTPSIAMLIFVHMSLVKYIGSGPYWKASNSIFEKSCGKNWWVTLLYFQNYFRKDDVCIMHSWYLAVDTQLFILGPLFVWPLWKYGRKFLPVIFGFIVLSVITLFTYFLVGGYNFSLGIWDDKMERTYFATHTRMGPWFVGIVLAYYLYQQRNDKIKLHWSVVICGWTFSLVLIATVIFGMHPLAQIDYKNHSRVLDVAYGSLSILAWSVSIAWIIFACVNGYGGFINDFLSWTFWQPLARLTYSMYLIHFSIGLLMAGSLRTPVNLSNIDGVYMMWGDVGFTLTISIVWFLAFESPFITIEKSLFSRGEPKKTMENGHKQNLTFQYKQ